MDKEYTNTPYASHLPLKSKPQSEREAGSAPINYAACLVDVLNGKASKMATESVTASTQGLPALPLNHRPDYLKVGRSKVDIKVPMVLMEYPILSLKGGDKSIRTYERDGIFLVVQPEEGLSGCATIYDQDLLIYCISHLVADMNLRPKASKKLRGAAVRRKVRFIISDFLEATSRHISGPSYKLFLDSLTRLRGTLITTNLEINGYRTKNRFGLIENWEVLDRTPHHHTRWVEVKLSEWLWHSVVGESLQVLTLVKEYFEERKSLARRIYLMARKHCGKNLQWDMPLKELYEKCGCRDEARNFRSAIKNLCNSNSLPEYRVNYAIKEDRVTFSLR